MTQNKEKNTDFSHKRTNPYKKKISELTKINRKLLDKIIVIEVQNIVLKNKVKSLNKYIKDHGGNFKTPAEKRYDAYKEHQKHISNSDESFETLHDDINKLNQDHNESPFNEMM